MSSTACEQGLTIESKRLKLNALKRLLEKYFSGTLLYKIAIGGYRYYRATQDINYKPSDFLYYGKNIRLEPGVEITGSERLYIGDDSAISSCQINAMGGCHLGRACQIAANAMILTIDHQYTGGESLPYDSVRLIKPIYIEDYVWIGARVIIAPGVRIGEGAIIGMGSVVFEDVPPLAIVAGNPAQVLTYRSREQFDKLKQAGAVVDPFKELHLLKIPPFTKRKFKKELQEFGIDVSHGEYFHYDKSRPLAERLLPVNQDAADKPAPK